MRKIKEQEYSHYYIKKDGTIWTKKDGNYKRKKTFYSPKGYESVYLKGSDGLKLFYIHDLIARQYLKKPSGENIVVDHIDRNKKNNHASNIRYVTKRQNYINSKRSDKAKGYTKRGNKWVSIIKYNIRQYYLGTFDTPELASSLYLLFKNISLNQSTETFNQCYDDFKKIKSKFCLIGKNKDYLLTEDGEVWSFKGGNFKKKDAFMGNTGSPLIKIDRSNKTVRSLIKNNFNKGVA